MAPLPRTTSASAAKLGLITSRVFEKDIDDNTVHENLSSIPMTKRQGLILSIMVGAFCSVCLTLWVYWIICFALQEREMNRWVERASEIVDVFEQDRKKVEDVFVSHRKERAVQCNLAGSARKEEGSGESNVASMKKQRKNVPVEKRSTIEVGVGTQQSQVAIQCDMEEVEVIAQRTFWVLNELTRGAVRQDIPARAAREEWLTRNAAGQVVGDAFSCLVITHPPKPYTYTGPGIEREDTSETEEKGKKNFTVACRQMDWSGGFQSKPYMYAGRQRYQGRSSL